MDLEKWLLEWHPVMREGFETRKVPIDPEVAVLAREHVRFIGINLHASEPRWEVFGDNGYVIGGDGDPNSLIEDLVARRGNYFETVREAPKYASQAPSIRSRAMSLLRKIGV